jgi:hypothetical protein
MMKNPILLSTVLCTMGLACSVAIAQAPPQGSPGDRSGGGAAEFSALTPCDEARFSAAERALADMPPSDRRTRAMQQVSAAREMFNQREQRACSIHLESAMLYMRK